MAELDITSQTVTGVTAIVKMTGDMDSGNFELVEDEFNKLLESGVIGVVLDVSGLDSMSSAGIGAIVNLSRILEERKGKLLVAAARPKIVGLLEMLGAQESLALIETAEQARKMIASLKQKGE